MHATLPEIPAPAPLTDSEKDLVREQLHRMLATPHFSHSRRYPALLRYLVEETLRGRGHLLKERVLGVEVFHRDPDYDTAADPIVRVTIAEIRKRIAQYYHDSARDPEIRIEMLPGRYAPEFRLPLAAPGPHLYPSGRHQPNARRPLSPAPSQITEIVSETGNGTGHATGNGTGHETGNGVVSGMPLSAAAHPAAAAAPPLHTEPHPEPHAARSAAPPAARPSRPARRRSWPAALAFAALALVVAAGLHLARPTALDQLWAPLIAPGRQVFFCLPTDVGKHRGALSPTVETVAGENLAPDLDRSAGRRSVTFLEHESLDENVVFSDVLALVRIANLVAVHRGSERIQLNVATSLDDLKQGPAVLLGGLDNQWTLRALAGLRYRFAGNGDEGYWISDTGNPADRSWSMDLKQSYSSVTRDYALIARLHNDQTGQPQMIVAGIGMSGTAAAGEFLVDPHQAALLRDRVGAGFATADFEAVLATEVVNGVAGTPKILAVSVR